MRLFSYKMTSDTGFAPNPFGRRLTLATCKPMIRQSTHEGDWVAVRSEHGEKCSDCGSVLPLNWGKSPKDVLSSGFSTLGVI